MRDKEFVVSERSGFGITLSWQFRMKLMQDYPVKVTN